MTELIINSEATKRAALDYIDRLPLDNAHKVTVKKHTGRRTLSQNALLHKWFDTIARETGDDPDSVKDTLCKRFLGVQERVILGERVMVRKSTADLEKREMTALMEQVYALAAQFGIYLPVPEDLHIRRQQ